jgi:hypothetical protein
MTNGSAEPDDGPGRLERRYRRLVAAYPGGFHREHAEEIVAVLMTGAANGQRRPGLADTASLLWSALRIHLRTHLRRLRPGPADRDWADTLALFSVAAPLLLVLVDALAVALPYHPFRPRPGVPPLLTAHFVQIVWGGPSLLTRSGGAAGIAATVLVAVAALLGLRRTALALTVSLVVSWIALRYSLTEQILVTSVCILEVGALAASPGPRRGRQLLRWRHGIALLLAAVAVHVWSLASAVYEEEFFRLVLVSRLTLAVIAVILAFTVVLAGLAVTLRLGWRLLLLLGAACYPFALQVVALFASRGGGELLGSVTLTHLAELYLPPVALAAVAVISATGSRRLRRPSLT